jgi:FixJ family two-component response regulator
MRISLSRTLSEAGYSVNDYQSSITFLTESVPSSPAVILLDMQMPDVTGIELQQKLLTLGRKTPIIFISGQSHSHQIVTALKNGAINFLFKPFNLEDLLVAVNEALDFDKTQLIKLIKEVDIKQRYSTLTPREKEVCSLLVEGLLNKEIAVKLGTSDATVKVHKARVMEKMRADSIQTLVKMCLEADLDNI